MFHSRLRLPFCTNFPQSHPTGRSRRVIVLTLDDSTNPLDGKKVDRAKIGVEDRKKFKVTQTETLI